MTLLGIFPEVFILSQLGYESMENRKENNLIRTKQKYGVISQNIMRHPHISIIAKSLYAYLAGFAGSENSAFPGRDLVCHEMGFNKDTFSKYMWELQCWQIVQVEQIRGKAGQFDSNLYILDHYPSYVMMNHDEFEEKVWPQLQTLIKSKGRRNKNNNPEISASSPCPKSSDMVEPDPVERDTNNNILKKEEEKEETAKQESASDNQQDAIPEITHEIIAFEKYTAIKLRGEAHKETYQKWRHEWGFSHELIMKAAELMCQLANVPNLAYIDQILSNWMKLNIRSVPEANKAIESFRNDRKVESQVLFTSKAKAKRGYSNDDYEIYIPPD